MLIRGGRDVKTRKEQPRNNSTVLGQSPGSASGIHITISLDTSVELRRESVSCSVVSNSLQPHGLYPTRLLHPWDSPDKSTGVGCHSLPQGIFLTQGSNLGLLQNPGLRHCSPVFYHLSHREANPQQMKDISVLHFKLKEPKKLFKRPPEARLKDSQKLMGPSKAKLNACRLFTHPNPYQQPALEPLL